MDEIREFLDNKVHQYNQRNFIDSDPVQLIHRYDEKEDIEIAGFLTATLAWGRRESIIRNAHQLMDMMAGGPYHFVLRAEKQDLEPFFSFVHRTFNGLDCIYFLRSLQNIYRNYGGTGTIFQEAYLKTGDLYETLKEFRKIFFSLPGAGKSLRHVSDVSKGSAAKRLNMYLRWMVRSDAAGVDRGIWKKIPMSALYIPLDVHSGNVARKLGLLKRKQDDWKAVKELTEVLRTFDPEDPVRFDYALFGLGVFDKF